MADVDVDRAIGRVLNRTERRFEDAIRALDPEAPVLQRRLSDAERWDQLAEVSRRAMAGFYEGVRRIGIILPILMFGTPEQGRIAERAMRGDNRG